VRLARLPFAVLWLIPADTEQLSDIRDRQFPAAELTPVAVNLSVVFMGDKSPKATSKQAAQKKAKANAANQKKKDAASAKHVPKK
jgi:hypothetical protein